MAPMFDQSIVILKVMQNLTICFFILNFCHQSKWQQIIKGVNFILITFKSFNTENPYYSKFDFHEAIKVFNINVLQTINFGVEIVLKHPENKPT